MSLAEDLGLHAVKGKPLKLLVSIVGSSLKPTKPRTDKPQTEPTT